MGAGDPRIAERPATGKAVPDFFLPAEMLRAPARRGPSIRYLAISISGVEGHPRFQKGCTRLSKSVSSGFPDGLWGRPRLLRSGTLAEVSG